MKKPKIVKVNYGIASNYGNFIEINSKLDSYPILKDKILNHEYRHVPGKYQIIDFLNDFQSKDSTFWQTLIFSLRNKEAIINFFPFMYSYYSKEWTFNDSSIPPFVVLGLIFVLFFHFIINLPFLHLIIGWIGAVSIINLILLYITHNYVKMMQNPQIEEVKLQL